MKPGVMLRDVLRSATERPATQRYPFERRPAPIRLRGMLRWDPARCTGCALCVKDCPAEAIELITLDKQAKRFVLRYYADRCTFCGQCAYSCRFDCLELTGDEWELADSDLANLEVIYGREEDIAAVEVAAESEELPESSLDPVAVV